MAFSDMYTCRVVSMIGGMFCCLGFLVPAYCTSAEQIVVTFGIFTGKLIRPCSDPISHLMVSGLGYGMCLLPGTVIVGRYFERHRSLANGLLFSGGGVGGMIVPLVLNYIIEQLGFRSALVILAGFALQTVVFASLYRPLTYWTKSARALTKVEAAEEKPQAIEECKEKEGPILLDRLCSVPEDRCLENGYAGSPPVVRPGRTDTHFRTSLPILPAYEKQNHLMNGTLQDRGYGSANIGSNASIYFSTLDLAWTLPPKQEASVDRCESVTKAEPIVEGSQDQAKPTRRNSKCKAILRRLCYAKAADGSELPLLDFSLMKEKRFLLFVISAGFFIPIIYIAMVVPPHCLELGMTKSEVAILLSIQGKNPSGLQFLTGDSFGMTFAGGADTAGRLITAAFGDRSFIKDRRKSVGVACFIVLSVTTYTAVFLNTFWGQASYLLVSSLARGAFVAMMPVILVSRDPQGLLSEQGVIS